MWFYVICKMKNEKFYIFNYEIDIENDMKNKIKCMCIKLDSLLKYEDYKF